MLTGWVAERRQRRGSGNFLAGKGTVQYKPSKRGGTAQPRLRGSDPRVFSRLDGVLAVPPRIRNLLSVTRGAPLSVAKIPRLNGRIGESCFVFGPLSLMLQLVRARGCLACVPALEVLEPCLSSWV